MAESGSGPEEARFARIEAENENLKNELGEIKSLLRSVINYQRQSAVSSQSKDQVSPVTEATQATQTPARMFTSTPAGLPRDPFGKKRESISSSPSHENPVTASHPAFTTQPAATTIDPNQFRLSDFPQYKGKYGDIMAYRIWGYQVEAGFLMRGMTSDSDKIQILPLLLANDPAASWCRRSQRDLLGHSWESVMLEMEGVILPSGWLDDAKQKIRELSMKPSEDMVSYCARARMLQEVAGRENCSDESLAYSILSGPPSLFRSWAERDEIVKTSVRIVSSQAEGTTRATRFFSFPLFEQRAAAKWKLVLQIETSSKSATPSKIHNMLTNPTSGGGLRATTQARPNLTPEEISSRKSKYAAYMRSVGLCPRCKTNCTKWQGGCEAAPNFTYIAVPGNFPRSPPFPQPRASSGAIARNNQMSGQRQLPRRTDVAGVEVEESVDVAAVGVFPELGRVDLEAYAQLIEKLKLPEDEDCVEEAGSRDKFDVEGDGGEALTSL